MSGPSDLDDQQVSPDVRFMMQAMRGEFERVNRRFDGLAERIETVEGELNRNQNGGRAQNRGQNGRENDSEGGSDGEEEAIRNPERGRNRGGRNRGIEGSDDDMGKIKMSIPKFQGKNDPEAYLEWVNKVERVFECHRYSERKKLKLAVLEFSEYATIWWEKVVADRMRNGEDPIASWRQLKAMMRRRFVPTWYQRELYQQLEGLVQGSHSVPEYVQEMDKLMTRLNIDENSEQSMARFHRGLNWEIKDEVDKQHYVDYEELVQLAIKIERTLKRRRTRTQSSSSWRHKDRNKVDAKAESSKPKESREQRDKGKEKITKPSAIKCFKCQGRGHIARECPNKFNMTVKKGVIVTDSEHEQSGSSDNAKSESASEKESKSEGDEGYVELVDGEALMVRRLLNIQAKGEEGQRETIFHSKCFIHGKVCNLIIDGGSCANVASAELVTKLGLNMQKHPLPYSLQWLNKTEDIKVDQQVMVPIKMGKYEDEVLCDVVPMQATHLLLGRPWQYDKKVLHDGFHNRYSFEHRGRKITLTPMTPQQIYEVQKKAIEKEKEERKKIEKNENLSAKEMSEKKK